MTPPNVMERRLRLALAALAAIRRGGSRRASDRSAEPSPGNATTEARDLAGG